MVCSRRGFDQGKGPPVARRATIRLQTPCPARASLPRNFDELERSKYTSSIAGERRGRRRPIKHYEAELGHSLWHNTVGVGVPDEEADCIDPLVGHKLAVG